MKRFENIYNNSIYNDRKSCVQYVYYLFHILYVHYDGKKKSNETMSV